MIDKTTIQPPKLSQMHNGQDYIYLYTVGVTLISSTPCTTTLILFGQLPFAI